MLIMNQSKDTVWNLDKIATIECLENGVVVQGDKAESYCTLGTYESEDRAKAVLMKLFNAASNETRTPLSASPYSVVIMDKTPQTTFEMPEA